MKILLHEYEKLEERTSPVLNIWKAWHVVLYVLVILFGIANYTFLLATKHLVDDFCVLYPQSLSFHLVNLTEVSHEDPKVESVIITPKLNISTIYTEVESKEDYETTVVIDNITVIIENSTHHLMLDTSSSIFGGENTCEFVEYMPVMSTIVGVLWTTLFVVFPGGGLVKRGMGLVEPWCILVPALVVAFVMFALTAHSLVLTNGGISEFCRAFQNYTNSTTCSSINPFLSAGRDAVWGFGGRAGAVRAACAGVWASWTCVTALLVARCIVAPDFMVKKTSVYLIDEGGKINTTSSSLGRKRPRSPPSPEDNISNKSEPTLTSQVVTASIEHENY